MNTGVAIAITIVLLLIPIYVIWRMARATARTVYALKSQIGDFGELEARVAKQNETIAEQRAAIDKLKVDVAAQNVIIELQGAGIEELQAEIVRLDAEWRAKLDALIAWVRIVAPEADVNGRVAQLEAEG